MNIRVREETDSCWLVSAGYQERKYKPFAEAMAAVKDFSRQSGAHAVIECEWTTHSRCGALLVARAASRIAREGRQEKA